MDNRTSKTSRSIHYFKIFFAGLFIITLFAACAPTAQDVVREEILPSNQVPGEFYAPDMASYRIQAGDILDVIYEFNPKLIENYTLQILDKVELRFPANPKLNQIQTIRADGKITLPYIGDVKIVNMTPEEATRYIQKKVKGVLRYPDIYLVVKEFGAGTAELKKVITTAPRGQSKLILVRPDGFSTFPIIGDVKVIGKTIPEVASEVNKKYHELYVELSVDVLLEKTSGNYIYVLGSVKKPGAYSIKRPLFVAEALAMAGGLTNESSNFAYIAHLEGNKLIKKPLDLKKLETGDSSVMLVMQPNDFLYVAQSGLSKASANAEFLRKVLMFRGIGVGASYDINNQD